MLQQDFQAAHSKHVVAQVALVGQLMGVGLHGYEPPRHSLRCQEFLKGTEGVPQCLGRLEGARPLPSRECRQELTPPLPYDVVALLDLSDVLLYWVHEDRVNHRAAYPITVCMLMPADRKD